MESTSRVFRTPSANMGCDAGSVENTQRTKMCGFVKTEKSHMSAQNRGMFSVRWSLVLVYIIAFCILLPQIRGDSSSEERKKGSIKQVKGVENAVVEDAVKSKVMPIEPIELPKDKADIIAKDPYGNYVDKGLVDLGFIHAFVASLSVIIVSELGDKTFFIAAIMAMRHPRLTVFAGAMGALGLMTVLSALMGFATTVIPRWFTYYVSCSLFAIFGLKMLREGYYMSADEGQEEYEEVQADLRKKEEEAEREGRTNDLESGIVRTKPRSWLNSFFSRIFLQSFTLTFLAEWGDRSQISTIILAARDEVIGVIIGGTLGHALCTGLAVMGGRFVAQKISIRTVTLVGGVVFLVFAASALLIDPDD